MERNTPPRPAKPGLKISAENISLMQKHAKGCGEVAETVARELGIPWLRLDFFLPDNGGEAVFNEFGFQGYTSRAAFFTVSYEFCIWACRIKGPPFFKQRKIQAHKLQANQSNLVLPLAPCERRFSVALIGRYSHLGLSDKGPTGLRTTAGKRVNTTSARGYRSSDE